MNTRQLNVQERRILDMLLAPNFPGVAELRQQAREALFEDLDHFQEITILVPDIAPSAKTVGNYPVAANWSDTHARIGWNCSVRLEMFAPNGRIEAIIRLNMGYDDDELPPLNEFVVEVLDEKSVGNRPPAL